MNKLRNFLTILILVLSHNTLANFGEICPGAVIVGSDSYLVDRTAYGQVRNNIDMTTYVNGCDDMASDFKFCLKDTNASNPVCTEVQMNVGDTKTLSSINNNPDLGGNSLLAPVSLTVTLTSNSQMCLNMPTSRGQLPVACKLVNSQVLNSLGNNMGCTNISNACYDASTRSQSPFNFSGKVVTCLRQSLDNVFYTGRGCDTNEIKFTTLAPFPDFQESLKAAIRALLILYSMFYGFKVVLNHEYVNLDKVGLFVMKFILVAYFSVGLGPVLTQNGRETTRNGVLEYGLPFFASATSNFAEMVFNSGGSAGLCSFDVTKYPNGYKYYAIWDSIDCRLGYYLGMQLLYNNPASPILNTLTSTTHSSGDPGSPTNLQSVPNPNSLTMLKSAEYFSFFGVLFGFFMAGNLLVVVAGIFFFIMLLSIIFYFLTTYLVCLVTLYVMAYISPIFVPCALFERTKSYFDSWLKICISCALQPAVIAGFIAFLLTMYDGAIYKNCQFLRHDYAASGLNFSTFELRLPTIDPDLCKSSAGYKLLAYYMGEGWQSVNAMLFKLYILKDILSLSVELFYVLVFSIIFYFFSSSIGQFAAEITGGPFLDKVVSGPMTLMNSAARAAQTAGAKASQAMKKISSSGSSGKSSASRAGDGKNINFGGAKDSISSGAKSSAGSGGGGEAKDSISSGGK